MKKLLLYFLLLNSNFVLGQSSFIFKEDLPCVNKQFNVFVHAVNNYQYKTIKEDDVKEAIAYANDLFAPICVSFKFCEMDTVFNYYYNSLDSDKMDELDVLYEQHNRINLFVILGGFPNPYIREVVTGSIDSLTGSNLYINSTGAFPQALGHFFGLDYTFKGDKEELVDGSNCETSGDKICDTPADPYTLIRKPSKYVDGLCRFIRLEKDPNGDFYQPDVTNIMSIFFGCHCKFSIEQYKRMAENIFKAKTKHW